MQDLQRHLSLIGKKDYVFVVIQIALGQLVCDLPSGEIEIRYIGIDDPGRRFAKLRGYIRIYTESPLQTQWHMNYLCANTRDEVSLYLSFN